MTKIRALKALTSGRKPSTGRKDFVFNTKKGWGPGATGEMYSPNWSKKDAGDLNGFHYADVYTMEINTPEAMTVAERIYKGKPVAKTSNLKVSLNKKEATRLINWVNNEAYLHTRKGVKDLGDDWGYTVDNRRVKSLKSFSKDLRSQYDKNFGKRKDWTFNEFNDLDD